MFDQSWITGKTNAPTGEVPTVSTKLTLADKLGHMRVRFSIWRMRYTVSPGLYAVGKPTAESDVFVSANYKMSFDHLRRELGGRDGWILVLDTRGINVWCAAGKGTFGTCEIINRVNLTQLSQIVSHRRLIVPQLGAPGIKAHEVKNKTGFTVRYGPVRVSDLPEYLDSGRKATLQMREVQFTIGDRLVLVPETIISFGLFGLAAGVGLAAIFSSQSLFDPNWSDLAEGVVPFFGGALSGAVLVPLLLPWLPGKSFSAKGAWAGVLYMLGLTAIVLVRSDLAPGWIDSLACILLALTSASFVGMNFTGASTYTSLSGVRKEMKVAVRLQVAALVVGLALWIPGRLS